MNIEYIVQLLTESGISSIFTLMAVATFLLLGKLPYLFQFYKNYKQDRQSELLIAIDYQNFSEKEKQVLQELQAEHVFINATGFDGSYKLRNLVLDFIDKSDNFHIRDFALISRYLLIDNQQLKINIYPTQWYFLSSLNTVFIVLSLFASFIFTFTAMILLARNQQEPISHDSITFLIEAFLFCAAMLGIYLQDSKRYRILNRLYRYDRSLFKKTRPNIYIGLMVFISFCLSLAILHYHITNPPKRQSLVYYKHTITHAIGNIYHKAHPNNP